MLAAPITPGGGGKRRKSASLLDYRAFVILGLSLMHARRTPMCASHLRAHYACGGAGGCVRVHTRSTWAQYWFFLRKVVCEPPWFPDPPSVQVTTWTAAVATAAHLSRSGGSCFRLGRPPCKELARSFSEVASPAGSLRKCFRRAVPACCSRGAVKGGGAVLQAKCPSGAPWTAVRRHTLAIPPERTPAFRGCHPARDDLTYGGVPIGSSSVPGHQVSRVIAHEVRVGVLVPPITRGVGVG